MRVHFIYYFNLLITIINNLLNIHVRIIMSKCPLKMGVMLELNKSNLRIIGDTKTPKKFISFDTQKKNDQKLIILNIKCVIFDKLYRFT